jgi:hypothetical protein
MKCLFSIAPEARKGDESPECLSLKNFNWTLDRTRSRVDLHVRSVQTTGRDARVKVVDRRVRSLADPERPVTLPVGSACLKCRSNAVAHLVTCDRTHPITRGALWTQIERQVQRVWSNGVACPVTATALSNAHCCCLSCSDRTCPVTLTGASGHHIFHCVVL